MEALMEDAAQGLSRAWAMRTSRDGDAHRRYVREELDAGVLRQGWGYVPQQDLRQVRAIVDDRARGWTSLSEDQRWAWGHWKMLGDDAAEPAAAMRQGDVVLVPNMPGEGFFTLCRIAGPYRYAIDPAIGDLGHHVAVEVLTPGGVANEHPLVSAELRRSLRCRSRLWWIGGHAVSLSDILARAAAGGAADLRAGSDPATRAKRRVAKEVRASVDLLTKSIEAPLRSTLQSAEWEPFLREALLPLLRDVQVIHTGGPTERGADLEIHVPNPFAPAAPWIIVVQVKDFKGQIGGYVAEQLEQAIQARRDRDVLGQLVAVVLASTGAEPSRELSEAMLDLSQRYGLSVSCVHGEDLMRVVARGMLAGFRDLPAG